MKLITQTSSINKAGAVAMRDRLAGLLAEDVLVLVGQVTLGFTGVLGAQAEAVAEAYRLEAADELMFTAHGLVVGVWPR